MLNEFIRGQPFNFLPFLLLDFVLLFFLKNPPSLCAGGFFFQVHVLCQQSRFFPHFQTAVPFLPHYIFPPSKYCVPVLFPPVPTSFVQVFHNIFSTLKVIDLILPYCKGGKIGLFGGAGVGKTVIIMVWLVTLASILNGFFW